jgi:hypothetical protein
MQSLQERRKLLLGQVSRVVVQLFTTWMKRKGIHLALGLKPDVALLRQVFCCERGLSPPFHGGAMAFVSTRLFFKESERDSGKVPFVKLIVSISYARW